MIYWVTGRRRHVRRCLGPGARSLAGEDAVRDSECCPRVAAPAAAAVDDEDCTTDSQEDQERLKNHADRRRQELRQRLHQTVYNKKKFNN